MGIFDFFLGKNKHGHYYANTGDLEEVQLWVYRDEKTGKITIKLPTLYFKDITVGPINLRIAEEEAEILVKELNKLMCK